MFGFILCLRPRHLRSLLRWFAVFSRNETPAGSLLAFAPGKSGTVSAPLQRGFRFLRHPLPAAPSVGLATALPVWENIGLTTFRMSTRGLGLTSPPVVQHLR